jgi:hypothetical protein
MNNAVKIAAVVATALTARRSVRKLVDAETAGILPGDLILLKRRRRPPANQN